MLWMLHFLVVALEVAHNFVNFVWFFRSYFNQLLYQLGLLRGFLDGRVSNTIRSTALICER